MSRRPSWLPDAIGSDGQLPMALLRRLSASGGTWGDLSALLEQQGGGTLPRLDSDLLSSPKWRALMEWTDDGAAAAADSPHSGGSHSSSTVPFGLPAVLAQAQLAKAVQIQLSSSAGQQQQQQGQQQQAQPAAAAGGDDSDAAARDSEATESEGEPTEGEGADKPPRRRRSSATLGRVRKRSLPGNSQQVQQEQQEQQEWAARPAKQPRRQSEAAAPASQPSAPAAQPPTVDTAAVAPPPGFVPVATLQQLLLAQQGAGLAQGRGTTGAKVGRPVAAAAGGAAAAAPAQAADAAAAPADVPMEDALSPTDIMHSVGDSGASSAGVLARTATVQTPADPGAQATPAAAAAAALHVPTKSSKAVPSGDSGVFTSMFRGVTKHKLTGRFEAHLWDSSYVRDKPGKRGRTRGRQVYLGGYETEVEAARAYDKGALILLGPSVPTNFPASDYTADVASMAGKPREEVVAWLRRGSVGFARGASQYRGVTKHHQPGRWESRIGRLDGGNKYYYLGSYDTPDGAARAYDRAAVKFKGAKAGAGAVTNFPLTDYLAILEDPDSYDPLAHEGSVASPGGGSGSPTAGAASPAGGCSTAARRARSSASAAKAAEDAVLMPPPRRGRAAPAARGAAPRAAAHPARSRAAALLNTDDDNEEDEEDDRGAAPFPAHAHAAAGGPHAAGLLPLPSLAAACSAEQAAATIGMAALLQQQAAAAVARANAAAAAAAGLWAGLPPGAQGQQVALLRQLGLAAPYPLGMAPSPEQQAAADLTLQSPTGARALAPIRTHARRLSAGAALAGGTGLRTLSTGQAGTLADASGWVLSPLGGLDLPSPLGLPRSPASGGGAAAAVARRDSFLSLLSGLSGGGTPTGGGGGGDPGAARKDSLLGLSNDEVARLLSVASLRAAGGSLRGGAAVGQAPGQADAGAAHSRQPSQSGFQPASGDEDFWGALSWLEGLEPAQLAALQAGASPPGSRRSSGAK